MPLGSGLDTRHRAPPEWDCRQAPGGLSLCDSLDLRSSALDPVPLPGLRSHRVLLQGKAALLPGGRGAILYSARKALLRSERQGTTPYLALCYQLRNISLPDFQLVRRAARRVAKPCKPSWKQVWPLV